MIFMYVVGKNMTRNGRITHKFRPVKHFRYQALVPIINDVIEISKKKSEFKWTA